MTVENFLIYPRNDPNSRFTIAGSKVTFTGLQATDDDTRIQRDFGAAYFSGDFACDFTIKITASEKNVGYAFTWAMSNTLNDYQGHIDASASGLFVQHAHPNSPDEHQINVFELDSGTAYAGNGGTAYVLTLNTEYFCRVYRDEAVGTYGTIYLRIYSDSARTNLLTTLSVALHTSAKDYRYLYAVMSYDYLTSTKIMTGYIEQMEVFEEGLLPDVTTEAMTSIASTTATGNGRIVNAGLASVTEHGHCWATTANPTTADSKTTNGAGSLGSFTSSLTGLTPGTKYYVRAYATNSYGTSYGVGVSFTAGSVVSQEPAGSTWVSKSNPSEHHFVGSDGVEYKLTGTAV